MNLYRCVVGFAVVAWVIVGAEAVRAHHLGAQDDPPLAAGGVSYAGVPVVGFPPDLNGDGGSVQPNTYAYPVVKGKASVAGRDRSRMWKCVEGAVTTYQAYACEFGSKVGRLSVDAQTNAWTWEKARRPWSGPGTRKRRSLA